MTVNQYIGLPYKDYGRDLSGIDCWGLACLYYKQELGIDLPQYNLEYDSSKRSHISEAIAQRMESWTETTTPEYGNLILFKIYGEASHVGIYLDNNRFLHARDGKDSVVESTINPQWSKRILGYYKYTPIKAVEITGAPHPLRTKIYKDWTVPGTTIAQFAAFIKNKYSVSDKLYSNIVILVDGVVVPRENWDTVVVESGQTLAYRAVPGNDAGRLILTLAIVVAVMYLGPLAQTAAAAASGSTLVGDVAYVLTAAVVSTAGMALINAIMPIIPPKDPGNAQAVSMFTGTSNQTNKFGAIPVVLGKVRLTGMLGATPYVESLSDTSLINLLIVWGFGPLKIDDIQVGTKPLSYYYEGFVQDVPAPVTLYGYGDEDSTSFDKLYGKNIEQKFLQQELVNNATDGNPWVNSISAKQATALDVSLTFPEGMRKVYTKSDNAGNVEEALCGVEIQYRPTSQTTWSTMPGYAITADSGSATDLPAFTAVLPPAIYTDFNSATSTATTINLYQWHILALGPGGSLRCFTGAASETQTDEPSNKLLSLYKYLSYQALAGIVGEYTRLPSIPTGYVPIYRICVHGTQGFIDSEDLRSSSSTYTGLSLTNSNLTAVHVDGTQGTYYTGAVKITVSSGTLTGTTSTAPVGVEQEIFTSRQFTGVSIPRQPRQWSQLLKEYGVWDNSSEVDFTKSKIVTFPYSGYYKIDASADDYGSVFIDSNPVLTIPTTSAGKDSVSTMLYLEAGTHVVQLTATNTGGDKSAACRITYTNGGFLNTVTQSDTVLEFGTNGFFSCRKDAFNFTYKITNLPKDLYEVRVRRTNSDLAEPNDSEHNYHKVLLLSVTAYSNEVPIKIPTNCHLARTAIRVQSTNKANGSLDGINALVQTIAPDWDGTHWTERPTNNPASLFLYVLLHPASAYAVKFNKAPVLINLDQLAHWHTFCASKNFTYNSVVTSTQSVLDVLRDIAAAGMASPSMIDGRWSVIIDEPRSSVTQHFTPHNSWGFESTKTLPRIPDAFRVTFPDETIAYQPTEIFVYKPGITDTGLVNIFEELRLPGVTNKAQAIYFAKWHYAQLILRPETYTLNTDFEYLVCTRGDWVKVAHDVPMWGTSTGRITGLSTNGTTINLSEQVYLETGKSYVIRIRTNTNSSVLKYLNTITTTGYYTHVDINSSINTDGVVSDNLYMLGELNKETQDLIVLRVEPMGNTSAKLTLVDYSPQIYTNSLDNLTYDPNITGRSIEIVAKTIGTAPIITQFTSDNTLSENISPGAYQNILKVSFANPAGLSMEATQIQTQIVLGNADFSTNSATRSYIINKDAASLDISNVINSTIYKVRARYTNGDTSIVGPWSAVQTTFITGKSVNYQTVDTLTMNLEGTYITAVPTTSNKPDNFKTYEYRCYRDTGIEDFWELDVVANNIKVMQTMSTGKFNLLDFTAPRLSASGITYRVACRAVDNNNNYSATSALGTIVIDTIK